MDVIDEVFAHEELLVALESIFSLKATEAFLAPVVAVFMLGNVTYYSEKILNPGSVAVLVLQIDLGFSHVSTAVNRVSRLAFAVVEPDHVDRNVKLLLDPREVDWTYGIFDRIEPVLCKVSSEYCLF